MLTNVKQQVIQSGFSLRSRSFSSPVLSPFHNFSLNWLFSPLSCLNFTTAHGLSFTSRVWRESTVLGLGLQIRCYIFLFYSLELIFFGGGGYWPTLKLPKFYIIKTMRRKGSLSKSVFITMVAKDKSASPWMLLSTGSIFKVTHSNNLNFQTFKNYIYGAHMNYTFLTPIPRYILYLLNSRLCSEILVNMPSYI